MATRLELSKVLGDWFGVGASSQLSNPNAVGNKSLLSSHPGIKFPQGLLEVGRDIVVKEISFLAKD